MKTYDEVTGSWKKYVPVKGVSVASAAAMRKPKPCPEILSEEGDSNAADTRPRPADQVSTAGFAVTSVGTRAPLNTGAS